MLPPLPRLPREDAGPSRLFELVDASNFYASCERVFRPDLRRTPIAVLSNNDGCVIARSDEVRAMDIPIGAPYFKIRRRLADAGVAVFSSNYELYADLSRRVVETLSTFTPDVEPYSIDESFLVFATPRPALREPTRLAALAGAIHDRVAQWTKIPVRASIASTKTLAKIASRVAKQRIRAGRVPAVSLHGMPPAAMDALLEATPVEAVWGVGRATAAKLHAHGAPTARHFRDLPDAWVRQHLHTAGLRTAYELRGVSCIPMARTPPPRRTLMRSRSFGRRVTRKAEMREALAMHATKACETLRAEGLVARAVQVFYHTARHGPDPQHRAAAAAPLPLPTARTADVAAAARRLLDATWPARPYRFAKAGLMLLDLAPADRAQGDLFVPERPAQARLDDAVDRLNRRFGRSVARRPHVFLASTGLAGAATPRTETGHAWSMRREHASPAYTTRWAELPRVTSAGLAR